jgi:hypothetical protein
MTEELLPGETKVYEFITTGDFSAKGDYFLEVFTNQFADANRLNDTIKLTISHMDPSGISDTFLKKDIHIFPNPASNFVNIKVPDEFYGRSLNIRLTDLSGRIVRERMIISATEINEVNLSGISPGFYQISVISSGESYSSGLYIY